MWRSRWIFISKYLCFFFGSYAWAPHFVTRTHIFLSWHILFSRETCVQKKIVAMNFRLCWKFYQTPEIMFNFHLILYFAQALVYVLYTVPYSQCVRSVIVSFSLCHELADLFLWDLYMCMCCHASFVVVHSKTHKQDKTIQRWHYYRASRLSSAFVFHLDCRCTREL